MTQGLQKGIIAMVFTSFLFAIENIVLTIQYLKKNDTIGLACVQLVITSLFMILLIFFFVYIIYTRTNDKKATCVLVCTASMCIFSVLMFALGITLDRITFG